MTMSSWGLFTTLGLIYQLLAVLFVFGMKHPAPKTKRVLLCGESAIEIDLANLLWFVSDRLCAAMQSLH